MTDKEYRQQKARIIALTKKWITPLGLRWWKVEIVYSRDGLDQPEDENRCLIAQTTVDWHYLLATITFDMRQLGDQSDAELESYFVHECCHILVNEMRMWAGEEMSRDKHEEVIKHEERVVTMLTKAFLWTRQAGNEEAKSKPNRKRR
jgi:hypothetical protein